MASRRNRKNTRRNRKNNSRKNTRRNTRRNYRGGYNPAPVGVDPMGDMTRQSLNQGQQFASFHAAQHGGGALGGSPFPGSVGGEALLSDNLAASARVGPLNASLNEIKGMQDGGRRRRRRNRKTNRKNRKGSRKNRANRKSRSRRYRGGAMPSLNPGLVGAPGQILPSSVTAAGMNPEWRLAENPRAFAP
jgi:hypothetical protein